MTADITFNINDSVTWTPTTKGSEMWNRYASRGLPAEYLPHVQWATPGQPLRVQAWEFMAAIGPHMGNGAPQLVERNAVTIHRS